MVSCTLSTNAADRHFKTYAPRCLAVARTRKACSVQTVAASAARLTRRDALGVSRENPMAHAAWQRKQKPHRVQVPPSGSWRLGPLGVARSAA